MLLVSELSLVHLFIHLNMLNTCAIKTLGFKCLSCVRPEMFQTYSELEMKCESRFERHGRGPQMWDGSIWLILCSANIGLVCRLTFLVKAKISCGYYWRFLVESSQITGQVWINLVQILPSYKGWGSILVPGVCVWDAILTLSLYTLCHYCGLVEM